jgi:2',3'-cyclic-nucleotide 2'-phosphodiesterase (5'-nucleotidase family)
MALLAVLASLSVLIPAGVLAATKPPPVTIQFLNISDWHAQLDPQEPNATTRIGGAVELAKRFAAHRAANANTLTLTAGDAFGASPPLSGFFDEVPGVLAMRMMGIDVDTFGNHNFDAGIDHLQDMVDLAAEPTSTDAPGEPFSFVSANLKNRDANLTGVKDFEIFTVGGVKVAVIGITNPEAPTLVFPGSFGTVEVTDPVQAAQKARGKARAQGAQVFVVLTHMGITGTDVNGQPTGPLVDFASQLDGFDIIFGDHTDVEYKSVINGALVTENRSKSSKYSTVQLRVQTTSGRGVQVLPKSVNDVEFIMPTAPLAVDTSHPIEQMLQPYREQLAPIMNEVIGYSDVAIPRTDSCGNTNGRICESLIGNVITDAMRLRYAADFAITNSGGIRSNLTCSGIASSFCPAFTPPPFQITRGRSFTVLPFGNFAMTLTVNGAELKSILEFGVAHMPTVLGSFQQVSGLCFDYDIAATAGSRVSNVQRQAANGTCTGLAVDLTAASSYKIVENDFMVAGGEGHPKFTSRAASDGTTLELVLADYLRTNSTSAAPISPDLQGRIQCTDSNGTTAPNCPVTSP